jgi:hypothetical protein
MAEDQAGHPGDHQQADAGRDAYIAGRDIVIIGQAWPDDADQAPEGKRGAGQDQASGQSGTGERTVFANHGNVTVGSQINANHGSITVNMHPSPADGEGTV